MAEEIKVTIKEVSVGYKGSMNYNSGEVRFTAEIQGDIDHMVVAGKLFEKCRMIVNEKLGSPVEEEEAKEESAGPKSWMKCPSCKKNCMKGYNPDFKDKYYCGSCKVSFG